MESDFIHFLNYVPYTHDQQTVYSPKLLALILQIGGYVDTVFKEMARFSEFQEIPECRIINQAIQTENYHIGQARSAYEKIYKLSSNNGAKLEAKLNWYGPKQLAPFKSFTQRKSPLWWRTYNDVKHKWSEFLKQANLINTLDALAGAFLLNAVHYPSIRKLWEQGNLKPIIRVAGGFKEMRLPKHQFDDLLKNAVINLEPINYDLRLETSLFVYEIINEVNWIQPAD